MAKKYKFSELSNTAKTKAIQQKYESLVADDSEYTLGLAQDFLESNNNNYLYNSEGEYVCECGVED